MEENRNDIEILKAMIKDNFEEQRKLIAKLETALEAVTSFNGKQMLDSRDMRLMLKVCDRTLIRNALCRYWGIFTGESRLSIGM